MIAPALLAAAISAAGVAPPAAALPPGFVHLLEAVPGIAQDMRYAGAHNFTAMPVPGYEAPTCIVTTETATALRAANAALTPHGYRLMVWDCYRPVRAVAAFVAWALLTDWLPGLRWIPHAFVAGALATLAGLGFLVATTSKGVEH